MTIIDHVKRLGVRRVSLIVMACVAVAIMVWRLHTDRPILSASLLFVVLIGWAVRALIRLAWRPPS